VYCTHCGREMAKGTSFCRFCGESQGDRGGTGTGAATAKPTGPLTQLDFIVISALVALSLLLILILAVT